jgi:hypothetical protein
MTWKLEEAKSRFDEVFNSTLREGPQRVLRGDQEVIVVAREEWLKLQGQQALDVLLSPEPRIEDMMIPERHSRRS